MIGIEMLVAIAAAYVVLEHGCRDRAASRKWNWFELIQLAELRISKKARTRGDIDHHGRTRRQQAHER